MRPESLNDALSRAETLPKVKQLAIDQIINEKRGSDPQEIANAIKGYLIEKNIHFKNVVFVDGEFIIYLSGSEYYFNYNKVFKNHTFDVQV